MLVAFDEELCREACAEVRPDLAMSGDTLEAMTRLKGSVGPALARRFVDRYPKLEDWPEPLRELVELLETKLRG
jgi:hypothetical protein